MSKRLDKMVTEAYQTIPLYVRHKDKQNLDIPRLLEEKQWNRMPLLERNEIVESGAVMMMPWAMPLMLQEKLMYARTSGSTGKYMEIYWTQEDYQRSMFSLWYYRYRYYQITPGDRVCYFYTINNVNGETDCVRRKNQLGFSKMNLDMDRLTQIYRDMLEFQPEWLMLQPSMAKLLCQCMDRNQLPPLESVRYIEFTGEILTKEVRKVVEEHFHCAIADQYGANEFNSIAFECPNGNMHVMGDNVLVEVLDEAKQPVWNQEGEVYVTTKTNTAMPLIRYGIGDRGTLCSGQTCLCGNHHPVFRLASGRANDWIIWENEEGQTERISSNVFVRTFDCINYRMDGIIKQFQVVQEDTRLFTIRLVVDEDEDCYLEELEMLFPKCLEDERLKRAEYQFEYYEELFPDEGTGKLKWFRCEIVKEENYV